MLRKDETFKEKMTDVKTCSIKNRSEELYHFLQNQMVSHIAIIFLA